MTRSPGPDHGAARFRVLVDDNYHYMDESHRRSAGSFETLEEAVAACKRIVDGSLREMYEEGMSAEELFGRYKMFGEDPFILGPEPGSHFSAWGYAEERAREITERASH